MTEVVPGTDVNDAPADAVAEDTPVAPVDETPAGDTPAAE